VAEYFIGTDIVSVVRIEKIIQKHPQRFIERTYTPIEIKYCDSKAAPPIHFAGRFAAKEASKKLYYLLGTTEKKSALDYSYWNNKLLYQISHNIDLNDFEKNFQNSVILSKNNLNLKKSLKLFYLRNIPRFSKETRDIVMSD